MSNYILKEVREFIGLNRTGDYIVLFGVDNVPPHIGFVHNTRYFSKSSQGVKTDYDFQKILSSVNRKKIATVLVSLTGISPDPSMFFDQKTLSKGESCLTPIKQMLSECDGSVLECNYLFDVIEFLSQNNYLGSIEHLNCSDLIDEDSLELMKYSQEEIDLAIEQAQRPC